MFILLDFRWNSQTNRTKAPMNIYGNECSIERAKHCIFFFSPSTKITEQAKLTSEQTRIKENKNRCVCVCVCVGMEDKNDSFLRFLQWIINTNQ